MTELSTKPAFRAILIDLDGSKPERVKKLIEEKLS
jgi:hypothetical protein